MCRDSARLWVSVRVFVCARVQGAGAALQSKMIRVYTEIWTLFFLSSLTFSTGRFDFVLSGSTVISTAVKNTVAPDRISRDQLITA